jgi:hypothetical protein
MFNYFTKCLTDFIKRLMNRLNFYLILAFDRGKNCLSSFTFES